MKLEYKLLGLGYAKLISKVSNVIDRLIWFLFLVSAPCLYFAYRMEGWKAIVFFTVAAIPIGLFVWAYIHFSCKNPDYLRSEEFHIKSQEIKFGSKDKPGITIEELSDSSPAKVEHPEKLQLEPPSEDTLK